MRIFVRTRRVSLPNGLSAAALGLVRRQLSHAAGRVRAVGLFFTDLNGPKGGSDLRLRVVVRLDRLREVVVTATAASAGAALDAAMERAARAIDRSLDRARDHRALALVRVRA